jgi:hypothetical protein
MQLGCASSCGEAYVWSPFAKAALGLPAHAPPPEHRGHGPTNEDGGEQATGNRALDALLALGSRLLWFFEEGENTLPGLAGGDNHHMLSVNEAAIVPHMRTPWAWTSHATPDHV